MGKIRRGYHIILGTLLSRAENPSHCILAFSSKEGFECHILGGFEKTNHMKILKEITLMRFKVLCLVVNLKEAL